MKVVPSLAVALLLALFPGSPARAQLTFALSGVHHVSDATWDAMSDASRTAFLEQRADLAVALGASAVRLGDVPPRLWSKAALDADTAPGRWLWADRAVRIFAERGLTLVIVVPDIIGSGLTAYRGFIGALAERYDGDADFGVATVDNNRDFPDIDDTGAITAGDWNAPNAQLLAWAATHTIDVIEIGNQPLVAEQAGDVMPGEYGTQLKSGAAAVRDSGGGITVMLAGTLADAQSASDFTTRLDGVNPNVFDHANVHLLESTKQPAGDAMDTALSDFTDWLAANNHPDVDRWVGAMSAAYDNAGPCGAWPCDERLQCSLLAKAAVLALDRGYSHFAYATPVEVQGSAADPEMPAATALLTLALETGADPTLTPIRTNRAYATWIRLQEILSEVDGDNLNRLGDLGPNLSGYALGGEKGWLVWYDWTRETSPGNGYDGSLRGVTLKGLPPEVQSVVASSLYPESLGDTLGAGFDAVTQWETRVYPVSGGEATVEVAADVVWVVPNAFPAPGGDEGPVEAVEEAPETPTDAGPAPGDSGGGEATARSQSGWPSFALALALAAGVVIAWRRRRPFASFSAR